MSLQLLVVLCGLIWPTGMFEHLLDTNFLNRLTAKEVSYTRVLLELFEDQPSTTQDNRCER
jgi:hypothetical protein